jgi:hypothetical protein
MSILHKRMKVRARQVARNKGEGRGLPIEHFRASSKKHKPQPMEFERASAREPKGHKAVQPA